MAKKNAIVSTVVEDGLITFHVEGQPVLPLSIAQLSDEVRNRALIHGLVQKVSDAAALGKDATPADKHAAMAAVVYRLNSGDWNKRGESDGSTAPAGIIRRAFVEFAVAAGKPETDANAYYEGLDRKAQLALRNIPEIADIINRIKSERGANASAKVDTNALLAEIGATPPAKSKKA
jgi:hypothetical protein